jgi:hypothetical protein
MNQLPSPPPLAQESSNGRNPLWGLNWVKANKIKFLMFVIIALGFTRLISSAVL